MDMQTKPQTRVAMDEVLRLMADHGPEMSSTEIREMCSVDDNAAYAAIGNLLKEGLIELAGKVKGKRGQTTRVYRLASTADASVNEPEPEPVDGPSEPDPLEIGQSEQHAGDEFERAVYVAPVGSGDPIIAAIERLAEPRWQEGLMHASRLRALAASACVAPHSDIAAWLGDLASAIEEMSHV